MPNKSTEKVDNGKFKNVFSYMMANRHKQDEVVQEMVEQEVNKQKLQNQQINDITILNSGSSEDENDLPAEDKKTRVKINVFKMFASVSLKYKKCEDQQGSSDFEPTSKSDNIPNCFLHDNRKKEKLNFLNKYSSHFSDDSVDDDVIFLTKPKNEKFNEPNSSEKSKVLNNGRSGRHSCMSPEYILDELDSCLSESSKVLANTSKVHATEDDAKLDLVNDEDDLNIEETFKEEILECVQKNKKRCLKKNFKLKKGRVANIHSDKKSIVNICESQETHFNKELNLNIPVYQIFKQSSKISTETQKVKKKKKKESDTIKKVTTKTEKKLNLNITSGSERHLSLFGMVKSNVFGENEENIDSMINQEIGDKEIIKENTMVIIDLCSPKVLKQWETLGSNSVTNFAIKSKILPIAIENVKKSNSISQTKAVNKHSESNITECVRNEEGGSWSVFPVNSHIKQITEDLFEEVFDMKESWVNATDENLSTDEFFKSDDNPCNIYPAATVTKSLIDSKVEVSFSPTLDKTSVYSILSYLKSKNSEFPFVKVFNHYKSRKEEYVAYHLGECLSETASLHQDKPINKGIASKSVNNEECSFISLNGNNVTLNNKTVKRKNYRLSNNSNKKRKLNSTQLQLKKSSQCLEETPTWHKCVPFCWSQVFAPKSSEYIIGNAENALILKEWLNDWKMKSEAESSKDKRNDDCSSSIDSQDYFPNSLLIVGAPGTGKTAFVYAVAQELGYKVLEVNASSCRQGKQVLNQLSEATQSHTVSSNNHLPWFCNSTTSSVVKPSITSLPCSTFKSQTEQNKYLHSENNKQKDVPKKLKCSVLGREESNIRESIKSQENNLSPETDNGKATTLILFEDIDIVFEDSDEGFISAVNSLMVTTKRPIIITSSLSTLSAISKLKGTYKKITISTPQSEVIAPYLQLMCLANGVFPDLMELVNLVKFNRCDIRKSIQDLQFWTLSGTTEVQFVKIQVDHLPPAGQSSNIGCDALFPNKNLSKAYFDLPISVGCLWNKPTKENLKGILQLGVCNTLDWSTISVNTFSLLPFIKKIRRNEVSPKYPLQSDDKCIKSASKDQHLLMFSSTDESDIERGPIIQNPDDDATCKKKLNSVSNACLNTLSNYYILFSDLDIFSTNSNEIYKNGYNNDFSDNWWKSHISPGLESVSSRLFFSNSSELICNLIQEISYLSLNYSQDQIQLEISSLKKKDEELSYCVFLEKKNTTLPLLPNNYFLCNKFNHKKLNQKICNMLPFVVVLNRCAIAKDYLPFVREIARSDQLSGSLQKYKRNRRFFSYFSQLGFYDVCPSELIKMANLFFVK